MTLIGGRISVQLALAVTFAVTMVAAAQPATPPGGGSPLQQQYPTLKDPRYGLLTPVPENGDIPPIVDALRGTTPDKLARMAEAQRYRQQLQVLRRRYFANRSPETRRRGLEQLRAIHDPAAFIPMIEVLRDQDDSVRLAVLDHFGESGESGQAALAWVAIHEADETLRAEATRRLTSPATPPVLWLLDDGLRDADHQVAANAGALAGSLNALETIPLLISAQVSAASNSGTGDLAWISVQRQTVYVQSLQAVTGNASGAFVPVQGVLTEGFVLRVQDAVVIIHRVAVHHSLVAMTSYDWGQSTAHLGYDKAAWWDWYNQKYVPYKNEQRILDELAREPGSD